MANKPLGLRQQRLVEVLTETDPKKMPRTQMEALIRAGYAESTAKHIGRATVSRPNVVAEIERRKIRRSDSKRMIAEAKRLLERASSGAMDSKDPVLQLQMGAGLIKSVTMLHEGGFEKDDTGNEADLIRYRKHLAKVVQTVSRWAATGNSAAIERYVTWQLGFSTADEPEQ